MRPPKFDPERSNRCEILGYSIQDISVASYYTDVASLNHVSWERIFSFFGNLLIKVAYVILIHVYRDTHTERI